MNTVEVGQKYTLDFEAYVAWYKANVSEDGPALQPVDVITLEFVDAEDDTAAGTTDDPVPPLGVWTGYIPTCFLIPLEVNR